MTQKHISGAEITPTRVVIVTMDTHLASATARARAAEAAVDPAAEATDADALRWRSRRRTGQQRGRAFGAHRRASARA